MPTSSRTKKRPMAHGIPGPARCALRRRPAASTRVHARAAAARYPATCGSRSMRIWRRSKRIWRAFEPQADGTVFQSFEWLAAWQRHIGARAGVTPAIVVGRDASGTILFLLPLSVLRGRLRARTDLARLRSVRLQRAAAGARICRSVSIALRFLLRCGATSMRCCKAIRVCVRPDQSRARCRRWSARSRTRCCICR